MRKSKQKEADIAAMKKGTQVKCENNHGHEDKVTPGAIYEVLDDRKLKLLIRIKDDRGKVIWIPKAHFDLVK